MALGRELQNSGARSVTVEDDKTRVDFELAGCRKCRSNWHWQASKRKLHDPAQALTRAHLCYRLPVVPMLFKLTLTVTKTEKYQITKTKI